MSDSTFKMEAAAAAQEVPSSREGTPTFPDALKPDALRPSAPKRRPPVAAPDPFRLGFRYRTKTDDDGRESVEQVPLRAEDLLYPQEGDVVADGLHHNETLLTKADSVRRHLKKKRPDVDVTCNVLLTLRSDGRNCAPNLAVIAGGIDRSRVKRGAHLRDLGGRLTFAFEVVSTSAKRIEEKDTARICSATPRKACRSTSRSIRSWSAG